MRARVSDRYDNLVRCESCGALIDEHDTTEVDNTTLCGECAEER